MNFILADTLGISIYLLYAALIVVSLLLLGVVLMQRPKQEGLGAAFGAALTDQAFGARTTDVLKKATVYFGSAFMIICLALTMLINREATQKKANDSLLSATTAEQTAVTPKEETTPKNEPVKDAPVVPATTTQQGQAPVAPAPQK